MPVILALRSPQFLSPPVARALFENHWLYWLVILAAATMLMIVGRSRADARLLKMGAVAAAFTLVWAAAAFVFTTPAERLYAVHIAMADAAAKGDADGVLVCMDRNFTIFNLNIHADTTADSAHDEIATRLKQLGIRQTHFTDYHVTFNDNGTTLTHFIALTESENGLIKSEWQILWNDEVDSDWRVKDATLQKLQNQTISPGRLVQ